MTEIPQITRIAMKSHDGPFVELPHVSEITEIGEQEVAIAEDSPGLARIEKGAAEGIRPLAREEQKEDCSSQGGKSRRLDHESPIHRL